MIWILKKNEFYRHKTTVFLRDEDIEKVLRDEDVAKVLVCNKICEKNYKYFFGYLYNDHKIKPLHMFPETSIYVK